MSTESVMPCNHLILCRPLLLPPSVFPSIRVFSNELALHITWPKYWSFSFSICPSNEYSILISFRMDLLDLCSPRDSQDSSLTPTYETTRPLKTNHAIFWGSLSLFLTFWDGPYSIYGVCFSLNKSTSSPPIHLQILSQQSKNFKFMGKQRHSLPLSFMEPDLTFGLQSGCDLGACPA